MFICLMFICLQSFLTDNIEKRQFDKLFNEHVLRVNYNSLNGNRRGSVFIRFTPGLCTDQPTTKEVYKGSVDF